MCFIGTVHTWHSHDHLSQRPGGPIEVIIRPGDGVYVDPGDDHWHGPPTAS